VDPRAGVHPQSRRRLLSRQPRRYPAHPRTSLCAGRGATGEPATSHHDVQETLPGHRLFTANDRESPGIARFARKVRDNQTRCAAVENE
jgi:hypothetical protein